MSAATPEPPPNYPADLRAARVQSYLEQLDQTAAACAKAIELQTAGMNGDLEMIQGGMPGWRFPDHTTGLASAARTQRLTMMLAVRLMDPPRAIRDDDEPEPPDPPRGQRPPQETPEPPDILEPPERGERLERERLDREVGDPDEARQIDDAIRDHPIPDIIATIEGRLAPKEPPPRLPPRNRPLPPPGTTPPATRRRSSVPAPKPAPPPHRPPDRAP